MITPLLTRRNVMSAAVAAVWAATMASCGNPTEPAAPSGASVLEVKAATDKPAYSPGEAVTITVTVTNSGPGKATNVRETSAAIAASASPRIAGQDVDPHGTNGIVWPSGSAVGFGKGFDLAAGESKTLTRRGVLDDWAASHGQASINWVFKSDTSKATPAKPGAVSLTVSVPGGIGDIVGTVCEGEQFEVLVCKYSSPGGPPIGVAGVKVTMLDPADQTTPMAQTTTDTHGNFAFHNVPVGTRFFRFEAPSGWHMVSGPHYQIQVVQGADPNKNKLLAGAQRN